MQKIYIICLYVINKHETELNRRDNIGPRNHSNFVSIVYDLGTVKYYYIL